MPDSRWLALLCLAACSRSPAPLDSCADPLTGQWTSSTATWHLLDARDRVDGFPIYRELPAEPPDTLAAPAVLALRRQGSAVTGTISRRWQQGAAICTVRSPATIRACTADRLALQLGPTGAPSDWTTCAPTGAAQTLLLRRSWP